MGFYVYILECRDKSYYTGHTDNIEKRMSEHQSGAMDGYTVSRLPVELVYIEIFGTRDEATMQKDRLKLGTKEKTSSY